MNRKMQALDQATSVSAKASTWFFSILVASVFLVLLLCRAEAGGEKDPWQPILPKEIHDELAKREAEIIREQLSVAPKDQSIGRAKFGAMFIAALAMASDNLRQLQSTVETALALADALNNKDQAAAKRLAAMLPYVPHTAPGRKFPAINWGGYLKLPELMDHLDVKSKGGDGIHPDLQTNIRFKGALNGEEAKIGELAKKELSAANLKKEAKELELLGYRCAVVGSLAYYFAPPAKQGKKDPQEWRKLSLAMRDQSVSLAMAAQKADPALVLKASSDLSSTCTQCHSVFK
jgi:hypothetical protein